MTDPNLLRGEIWLVNLDPTIGHEIQKTRPANVIGIDANQIKSASVDRFLKKLGTVTANTLDDVVSAVALCIDL